MSSAGKLISQHLTEIAVLRSGRGKKKNASHDYVTSLISRGSITKQPQGKTNDGKRVSYSGINSIHNIKTRIKSKTSHDFFFKFVNKPITRLKNEHEQIQGYRKLLSAALIATQIYPRIKDCSRFYFPQVSSCASENVTY